MGTLAYVHNLSDLAVWTSGGSHAKARFTWTYSDPDGGNQSAWRIRIYDSAGKTNLLHDSTKTTGTATTYDSTYALVLGTEYWYTLQVWDDMDESSGESSTTAFKVRWGQAMYEFNAGTWASPSFVSAEVASGTYKTVIFRGASGPEAGTPSHGPWVASVGSVDAATYPYLQILVRLLTTTAGTQPGFTDMTLRYTGASTDPDHWTQVGAWALDNSVFRYGSRSFRCTVASNVDAPEIYPYRYAVGDDVFVQELTDYMFSVFVKTDGALGAGSSVRLALYTGGGATLLAAGTTGQVYGDGATSDSSAAPEGWKRLVLRYKTTLGQEVLRVKVQYVNGGAGSGDIFWVDAGKAEPGTVASAWAPGWISPAVVIDSFGIQIDGSAGATLRLRNTAGDTTVDLDTLVAAGTSSHPTLAGHDSMGLATDAELAAHTGDTTGAHAASAISILDTANDFTATDVEGALAELQADAEADATDLSNHLADTSDAHDASAISILDTANDFTATDVEGALAELQADAEADATDLANHLADTSDAHDASAISILDTANDFTATDVEGALAELQADAEAHLADTSGAHAASAISFTPNGSIAATDVQAAIQEVRDEAGGSHPDLATHDALGLATDAELASHVGAADPHTGYRLESADHSHASTGLQGGTIAHSALTGITATDHHSNANDHAQSHNHSAAGDGTTVSPAALVAPSAANPAQTAMGSMVYDSTDDWLTVGTSWGSRLIYLPSLNQTPAAEAFGSTAVIGDDSAGVAKGNHRHAMPADPVTAHEGAADPHTGYRLESADHSHATTGLQGGIVAASSISFTPNGSIAATDVQAAIQEVRDEAAGGGAPSTADYLVGTANGGLSSEIVVGTTPGGELGGTWASPTVDATHSGSAHHTQSHDHSAAGDGQTLSPAGLNLPVGEGLPVAEGAVTWDGTDDVLRVGGGGATSRTIVPALGNTPSTQAFGDAAAVGTIASGTPYSDHKHAMPANPVTAHEGAADPHTGYRLESADHSHASTGLQGGVVAASAISFTPNGSIAATDVQAAIQEVRDEAGGGGAPTTADYLVGTAQAGLSAEIVVGATPGGELGGTWASPTVDATHSGSAHHAESHTLASHSTKAHSELTGVGENDHGRWTAIITKAADESVTTSTVLQNDDDFFFTTVNLAHYEFEMVILYVNTAGNTGDLKMVFGEDTNNRGVAHGVGIGAADTASSQVAVTDQTETIVFGAATGERAGIVRGAFRGAAGIWRLKWAQNASGGTTKILAGSIFRYRRVV